MGREGEEDEVKEHSWAGKVDGGGNGKGKSALKKVLLVVEYGNIFFWRYVGAGSWVFYWGEEDNNGGSA